MNYDVSTLDQLQAFGIDFISSIKSDAQQAKLITLSGDLGAGKTTLTQLLGKELGVSTDITSPTYVIEQRYDIKHPLFKTLVHIDAYRLEQEDDALKIGLEQTLSESTNLVIIEWPEKIADFLENYKKVEISIALEDEKRILEIRK